MATNNVVNDGTRTIHSMAIYQGTNSPTYTTLTNGQLFIGSTGADPVAATLSAGIGVTITNAAGSITINASGGGVTWNDTTNTTATIDVNNGYVADNAALVTFTLPATAVIGDTFCIVGKGAGGWTIAQNANQAIHLGNVVTTTGVGGSISSSNQWDSITCVCVTAGASTIWTTRASVGNLTYV